MRKRRVPYRICRYCGGNLDPGETCDCQKMGDQAYTDIEGAGYRLTRIRYEGMGNPERQERRAHV